MLFEAQACAMMMRNAANNNDSNSLFIIRMQNLFLNLFVEYSVIYAKEPISVIPVISNPC